MAVGTWGREPSLFHLDGRQRKKQKGAHSKNLPPSILLPLVESYFPKFPKSLRIAPSVETKAPVCEPLQQQWWRGGAIHIQTSTPTSFPRVLLVRTGHMIAADCLGGGKCGLCLDSQVSAYSSRVK